MISIPLLLSNEHLCSYLDGELARSLFVNPALPLSPALYAELLAKGFRRSGDNAYRPHCLQCQACIPIRLDVNKFKPNRSQQRCQKKNCGTNAIIKPAVFEQAHYDLYLRYQKTRHGDGEMANSSPDDYLSFLSSSWCDTRFVEFSINGELTGVAVVDQFENALSAVYTFFEPKFSNYGLGVYAVLWQIAHAQSTGRQFLYLGYWIQDSQKMAYKQQFNVQEMLVDGEWIINAK